MGQVTEVAAYARRSTGRDGLGAVHRGSLSLPLCVVSPYQLRLGIS